MYNWASNQSKESNSYDMDGGYPLIHFLTNPNKKLLQ